MNTVSDMDLRVWVEDVWGNVVLSVSSDWTIARLKEDALRSAIGSECDSRNYSVKFHGALILDEKVCLSELDVSDSSSFIVLAARRRPVR